MGREVTETSCKETDERERRGGGRLKSSTATFILFEGLQRAAGSEQMS